MTPHGGPIDLVIVVAWWQLLLLIRFIVVAVNGTLDLQLLMRIIQPRFVKVHDDTNRTRIGMRRGG
jgi:hypothetical protein